MSRSSHVSLRPFGLAVVSVTLLGCGGRLTGPAPSWDDDGPVDVPAVAAGIVDPIRPGRAGTVSRGDALAAKYLQLPPEDTPDLGRGVQVTKRKDNVDGKRRMVKPLPIEGTWVPSGWMGDAAGRPDGPLSYRVYQEADSGTFEEWSYEPAEGSRLGWVAAAYQYPDSNFGDAPGKNLSRRGFTQLTFRVRGRSGSEGETLIVKSGGHTRPGVPHPASYESDPVIVMLEKQWRTYSIPLDEDLSNVPTAFTFVLRGGPCVFDLDDITFRGPDD